MKIIGKTEDGSDIKEWDTIVYVDKDLFRCVEGVAIESFIGSNRQKDHFVLFANQISASDWIDQHKPKWSTDQIRTALQSCNIAAHFAETIIKFLKENTCKPCSSTVSQQD